MCISARFINDCKFPGSCKNGRTKSYRKENQETCCVSYSV